MKKIKDIIESIKLALVVLAMSLGGVTVYLLGILFAITPYILLLVIIKYLFF